jgi:hypothetical protein
MRWGSRSSSPPESSWVAALPRITGLFVTALRLHGKPVKQTKSESSTIVSDVIRAPAGLVYRQTALDRMKLGRYPPTMKPIQEVPR